MTRIGILVCLAVCISVAANAESAVNQNTGISAKEQDLVQSFKNCIEDRKSWKICNDAVLEISRLQFLSAGKKLPSGGSVWGPSGFEVFLESLRMNRQ